MEEAQQEELSVFGTEEPVDVPSDEVELLGDLEEGISVDNDSQRERKQKIRSFVLLGLLLLCCLLFITFLIIGISAILFATIDPSPRLTDESHVTSFSSNDSSDPDSPLSSIATSLFSSLSTEYISESLNDDADSSMSRSPTPAPSSTNTMKQQGVFTLPLENPSFANRPAMITQMIHTLNSALPCTFSHGEASTDIIYQKGSNCMNELLLVKIEDINTGKLSYTTSLRGKADSAETLFSLPLTVSSEYISHSLQYVREQENECSQTIQTLTSEISGLDTVVLDKCSDIHNYFPDVELTSETASANFGGQRYWWTFNTVVHILWEGKTYPCESIFQLEYLDYQSAATGIITQPISSFWSLRVTNYPFGQDFENVSSLLNEVLHSMMNYQVQGTACSEQ